jgi:CBS domain-containing protein
MHTVSDVMTSEVVTVEEKTSFKDIVERMHRQHVSTLPVLDPAGRVLGVVSKSDLLLKPAHPDAEEEFHLTPGGRRRQRKASGTIASELMTSPAITVPDTAGVDDAMRAMRRHRVSRLPVVDASTGRLIGIVGRADVLSVYRRPDADIRQDVLGQVVERDFAMEPTRFEVTVTDGRVAVKGTVERRSQIPALLYAIRRVEGVVSAHARLGFDTDDVYVPNRPYF